MKNALILHGTNGTPQGNWLPWLKTQLEQKHWKVWSPQLPHAEKPSLKRYNEYLLKQKFALNENTYIIGHSSGAVAALGFLQQLPENTKMNTIILVGAFKDDLGWEALKELFDVPLNFEKIKKHARHFFFIHSDNDPYCPLDHATYLAEKLDGELIIRSGEKHFSTEAGGEQYKEFPFILTLIK